MPFESHERVPPSAVFKDSGQPLTMEMLRGRFEAVRTAAVATATKVRQDDLAARIKAFQSRDISPKAASEINSLDDVTTLHGHTDKGITKRVYRRAGELVKPTE